jgi:DNA-binding MarR family transcriptional regulator
MDLAVQLSRSFRELGGLLASRRVLAAMRKTSDRHLTPTKLRALDLVAEGDGLRVGDLAARLYVDETTATRLVDRLEQMGVAARVAVESDGRGTEVVLTGKGERLMAAVSASRQDFFRDVLAALEPEERSELVRLLGKAIAAVRERSREPVAR